MIHVDDVCVFLETFAPPNLAEQWDNVGLLVGRRDRGIDKVMTCLTVTSPSVDEAIDTGASLVVAHHPIPFRPLKQITDETVTGRHLLSLIEHGIAVYSPHTAFDSARFGINQSLAERIGLNDIRPLIPLEDENEQLGAGRLGTTQRRTPLDEFAHQVKQSLSTDRLQVAGDRNRTVRRVAIGCGSAGKLLEGARRHQCDLFITGETSFHTCLEAEATGIAMLLTGHYASEAFAVKELAERINAEFPGIEVWASRQEANPLRWL